MRLTRPDIDALERRRRAALVNAIAGFRSAALVATATSDGHSNLAIMSSLLHVGSNPPLLGLLFRPDSVDRHTLTNIRDTGAYTINHVQEAIIEPAHQTSARYPRNVSEFRATGLTELWRDDFAAPFVAEASIRMAMQLAEEHTLASNGTHLVVGEIMAVEVPDDCLLDTGGLDPAAAQCVAVAGLDSYYGTTLLRRLAYATPADTARPLDHGDPDRNDRTA